MKVRYPVLDSLQASLCAEQCNRPPLMDPVCRWRCQHPEEALGPQQNLACLDFQAPADPVVSLRHSPMRYSHRSLLVKEDTPQIDQRTTELPLPALSL